MASILIASPWIYHFDNGGFETWIPVMAFNGNENRITSFEGRLYASWDK